MAEFDRRGFLKLVGASAGAAAAAGCSDPVEKLIPYVIQPEEITPGLAVMYASTCQECSVGCGLHVRTREGRPVKLEGNPEHPINRGKLCARGQAALSRTYHPDRYRGPVERDAAGAFATVTWEQAIAKLAAAVGSAGRRVAVLGGAGGPDAVRPDRFLARRDGRRHARRVRGARARGAAQRLAGRVRRGVGADLRSLGRRLRDRLRLRLPRNRALAGRARAPDREARDAAGETGALRGSSTWGRASTRPRATPTSGSRRGRAPRA